MLSSSSEVMNTSVALCSSSRRLKVRVNQPKPTQEKSSGLRNPTSVSALHCYAPLHIALDYLRSARAHLMVRGSSFPFQRAGSTACCIAPAEHAHYLPQSPLEEEHVALLIHLRHLQSVTGVRRAHLIPCVYHIGTVVPAQATT
jgi:hypothetical protein